RASSALGPPPGRARRPRRADGAPREQLAAGSCWNRRGRSMNAERQAMLESILSQLVVIDDFMPDFDAFRERALAAEYRPLGGGILETGLYTDYFGAPDVIERIAAVVGYP